MKTGNGILVFMAAIFLFSCYTPRYVYSPSAQNVPVLVKKGDSKLAANYSANFSASALASSSSDNNRKKSSGFDLQGAVAITGHLALQANYFNRTERNTGGDNNVDSTAIRYKRNLAEVGIGYYTSLHRRDKVMFQVFAGAGKGSFIFTDIGKDRFNTLYSRQHDADIWKVYFQPAFQFRVRQNFALSLSSRLSLVNYSNIVTDYTETELQQYQLNNLHNRTIAFWEPAFTNSFGFNKLKGVKFEYQLGASLQVSGRAVDYRSFNFSAGLLLDIPKMFQPAVLNE